MAGGAPVDFLAAGGGVARRPPSEPAQNAGKPTARFGGSWPKNSRNAVS